MLTIRKANDRGHTNHAWLDSYHTFSFSDYYDERFRGFRSLQVINEDVIAPGKGFDMHAHSDVEIITYVLEGELQHQDDLGNTAVLRAGEFQRISAGAGINHSEFNPSTTEPVHLYQIWIEPDRKGRLPRYDQRLFAAEERRWNAQLIASPDGDHGSIKINQQVVVFLSTLSFGHTIQFPMPNDGWLQILRGAARVNGHRVDAGDGIAIAREPNLEIEAAAVGVEVMMFQFP